jgi:integrase
MDIITDRKELDKVRNYLKGKNYRDYLIFEIGIHTGMRASDLLKLRVKDVLDKEILIKESKTGKKRDILFQDHIVKKVRGYAEDNFLHKNDYIFLSKKVKKKPLTTGHARNIIKDACEKCNISGKFGMHTLRKVFGYFCYKDNKDIVAVQELFKHRDTSVTMRYIGLDVRKTKHKLKNMII